MEHIWALFFLDLLLFTLNNVVMGQNAPFSWTTRRRIWRKRRKHVCGCTVFLHVCSLNPVYHFTVSMAIMDACGVMWSVMVHAHHCSLADIRWEGRCEVEGNGEDKVRLGEAQANLVLLTLVYNLE